MVNTKFKPKGPFVYLTEIASYFGIWLQLFQVIVAVFNIIIL